MVSGGFFSTLQLLNKENHDKLNPEKGNSWQMHQIYLAGIFSAFLVPCCKDDGFCVLHHVLTCASVEYRIHSRTVPCLQILSNTPSRWSSTWSHPKLIKFLSSRLGILKLQKKMLGIQLPWAPQTYIFRGFYGK